MMMITYGKGLMKTLTILVVMFLLTFLMKRKKQKQMMNYGIRRLQMKVSELQELLKKYEPDTQLIVAVWDKECFKAMDSEARLLTDKEWNIVATEFVMQFHDQMLGADIRKALEKQQSVNDEWSEQLMNDILAEQRASYEDSNLWDMPTTKTTGVSNDN